jgi:uridine kinase
MYDSFPRQFLQGVHVSFNFKFYVFSEEEMKNIGKYNFDHPDAFDWELARSIIKQL